MGQNQHDKINSLSSGFEDTQINMSGIRFNELSEETILENGKALGFDVSGDYKDKGMGS